MDVLIITFYNSVTRSTRDTINVVAGGSLIRKTVKAVFALLEEMANNSCLWPSKHQNLLKQGSRIRVDAVTSLYAQIAALSKQLGDLNQRTTMGVQNVDVSIMVCMKIQA